MTRLWTQLNRQIYKGQLNKDRPTWRHLFYYFTISCSTCFECYCSHLQKRETYCGFISCVVLLWFDTTPPQPNHTVTPTHIEPEQYNTWKKFTISRKLLKIDVLTFETYWAVNSEIINQVTPSWSIFIQIEKLLIRLRYNTYFRMSSGWFS